MFLGHSKRTGSAPSRPAPVFLHTGWRSAGTWIWSCFRELPQVRAYYEPYNLALGLRREDLSAIRPEAWASGHPELEAPYFQEYLDLTRPRGGVKGYSPSHEVDRFERMPVLDRFRQGRFLRRLVARAQAEERVAVMKFCRSMGRLPWMLEAFPRATHLAVVRNPVSQWSSFWSQWRRHGNPWFVAATYRVLGRNLRTPRVQSAVQAFGLDGDCLARLGAMPEPRALVEVQTLPVELSYRVHLAHWTVGMLSLDSRLDAILDSDQLATSEAYRSSRLEAIRNATGLDLSFASARSGDSGKHLLLAAAGTGFEAMGGLDLDRIIALHGLAEAFASRELRESGGRVALASLRAKLGDANRQFAQSDRVLDPAVGDSYR